MKQTDESKIEKIRAAAMEVVSRQGVVNSSVAAIAQRAGVSTGYLYRHYPSKEALIKDIYSTRFGIINEKISLLIKQGQSLSQIIREVVKLILEISYNDDARIKFLIMMLNDFSVVVEQEVKEDLEVLVDRLSELAKKDEQISPDVCIEDIYMAMIVLPMQYHSIRSQLITANEKLSRTSDQHIIDMALRMVGAESADELRKK